MRRSANKLCAKTHYDRYVKYLLGIKFTELAEQHVSQSEESKVITGNPFPENISWNRNEFRIFGTIYG